MKIINQDTFKRGDIVEVHYKKNMLAKPILTKATIIRKSFLTFENQPTYIVELPNNQKQFYSEDEIKLCNK